MAAVNPLGLGSFGAQLLAQHGRQTQLVNLRGDLLKAAELSLKALATRFDVLSATLGRKGKGFRRAGADFLGGTGKAKQRQHRHGADVQHVVQIALDLVGLQVQLCNVFQRRAGFQQASTVCVGNGKGDVIKAGGARGDFNKRAFGVVLAENLIGARTQDTNLLNVLFAKLTVGHDHPLHQAQHGQTLSAVGYFRAPPQNIAGHISTPVRAQAGRVGDVLQFVFRVRREIN